MASKFKIKVKIQGFELEVEGSREDVADLTQSVSEQLSGLMRPGGAIIEGTVIANPVPSPDLTPRLAAGRPKRRKTAANSSSPNPDTSTAIAFKHDPGVHGMPRQEWKTAQKAMWLINVLKSVNGADSFSTRTLVETFNKNFKQAGTITTSNVTRDLGKARMETPAPVGEDTTMDPSLWFLTDEGTRKVTALMADARSAPADN